MPAGRPARPAAAAIQSSKEPSRELRFDLLKLLADLSSEFLEARIQGPFGGWRERRCGRWEPAMARMLRQWLPKRGASLQTTSKSRLKRLHQKLIRIERYSSSAYLSDCKRVKVVFLQHYFNDRKGQGGCAHTLETHMILT